jgi:hypothetical protein
MNRKFGWSYPPGAANDPNAPYNQVEEMDYTTMEFDNADEAWNWLDEHKFIDLFKGFKFKDGDGNEAILSKRTNKIWEIIVIPNE